MMQTFTSAQYLKIDIATNFGLDKEDWDDRIAWFDENEHQLDLLITQAEEPALFFAGVKAWKETQEGKATAYPISLDATASGAQLLSILIGCEKSAKLCNVIDTGTRADFYTEVYEGMKQRLMDAGMPTGFFTRKKLKDAVMPWFYSSDEQPKNAFGEGDMLQIFQVTMQDDAPGVTMLREAMLNLWQKTALSHDWILPDNFNVKVKVMDKVTEPVLFLNRPYEVDFKVNKPTESGRSIGANVTHSLDGMVVREMTRRCAYNMEQLTMIRKLLRKKEIFGTSQSRGPDAMVQLLWEHYQRTGFLSTRILDYLDDRNLGLVDFTVIQELVDSMPKKPFPILSVHDCFRVHPNYGNDLRRQYNRVLYEIARSRLLEDLASQIAGTPVKADKFQDFADRILEANYALS